MNEECSVKEQGTLEKYVIPVRSDIMLSHTLGVKTAAKIITAVNYVQCYPNCKESHSEVYVSFLFSFLYLRPYRLTRDDADAYDVSLFYFLMFIIIFSHLVWLSVDIEKTDVRIRWW